MPATSRSTRRAGSTQININAGSSRRRQPRRGRSARYSSQFPRNAYGRVYFPRYTEEGQALFGSSWRDATPEQRRARIATGFTGPGDYQSFLRGIGKWGSRGIGAIAGGMYGALSGNPMNIINYGKLGYGVGAQFSKQILGTGDYSTNQLINGQGGPITVNSPTDNSGDIYISHREFIGNVVLPATSQNFNVVKYDINPGLQGTFPWLSQLAANYTLYEFYGLIFEYKPLSSHDNGTSFAMGKVVMATQYDPDAPPFTSTIEMENYDYSNSARPSDSMLHGVETANNQQVVNLQYIRDGDSLKDKIFTDIGTFYVATEGTSGQNNQVIGELWVSYKVKLSRARLYQTVGNALPLDSFILRTANSDYFGGPLNGGTGTDSPSAGYVLVNNQYWANEDNSIGGTLVRTGAAALTYIFPDSVVSGHYLLMFMLNGVSLSQSMTRTTGSGSSMYVGLARPWPDFSTFPSASGTAFKYCNDTVVINRTRGQSNALGGVGATFTWTTLTPDNVPVNLFIMRLPNEQMFDQTVN